MLRLKNRQMQVPGGMTFEIPELGWKVAAYSSFSTITNGVIQLARANPGLFDSKGWPKDPKGIDDWVDYNLAAMCQKNGWTEYIIDGTAANYEAPSPKFKALSPLNEKQLRAVAEKVKKVWQGVKTINDWIESGEPAVPHELADARAATCVSCPLNGKGGLEEWFTKPAAAAIQGQIAKLSARKLTTAHDEQLNVCTACLCPLKLKVHTPLPFISQHLSPEVKQSLHPGCWILKES